MGKGGRAMPHRYMMPRTSAEHTEARQYVGFQVKLPITVDA